MTDNNVRVSVATRSETLRARFDRRLRMAKSYWDAGHEGAADHLFAAGQALTALLDSGFNRPGSDVERIASYERLHAEMHAPLVEHHEAETIPAPPPVPVFSVTRGGTLALVVHDAIAELEGMLKEPSAGVFTLEDKIDTVREMLAGALDEFEAGEGM